MTGATPGYWALVAATLGVGAVMLLWTLPFIIAEAGGQFPFDLRPLGYEHAEAVAFLSALSEAGLARYAGMQHVLDAIFPPLLFATLAIALWHLSDDLVRPTRIALIVVAAIGMGADGFENVAVRDMLAAGPDGVTPEMVARASFLTVAKWSANLVALLSVAVLLARRLRRPARTEGDDA
jgi:hypothetical protein